MTGIALVALAAFALVAASLYAMRRRRKDLGQRLAIATPGGRAFANNVGSLSDFRMELRLPRARR
jgi:hypothetical protein